MQIIGLTRTIGASIGITLGGGKADVAQAAKIESENSPEGECLLSEADIAMYAAKKAGRNNYRLYTDVVKDIRGK